ncbi:MAG: methionine gamma-lyase family protein [Anaerovoracaceae bacterium]
MPGYESQVVMAAGAFARFTELSADAPMRELTVYTPGRSDIRTLQVRSDKICGCSFEERLNNYIAI